MLSMREDGRNGSLTRIIVEGDTAALEALIDSGVNSRGWTRGEGAIRSSMSKADVMRVREYVNKVTAVARPAQSGRYVERLIVAQRDGLNHGRSWTCTLMDVDRHSLDPSWEDQQICYVYPR